MRTLALDSVAAVARFGEPVAAWLHALLAEIEAAGDALELFSLYGASARAVGPVLELAFAPGFIAKFAVVREKGTLDDDGSPNWAIVQRLKLLQVVADEPEG